MKFLLLMFLSFSAYAADYTLTWDIPIERVDGTSLPIGEVGSYSLWVDDELVIGDIPPDATTATITVQSGQRCFKMNTEDTEGRIGPFSDVACKEIKGAPNAPAIITIDFVSRP